MNRDGNLLYKFVWQSALFWTFAFFSYIIFRFYGIEEDVGLNENQIIYQGFKIALFIGSMSGLLLGIVFGVISFLYEKHLYKKFSLGVGLLVQAFLNFLATVITFNLSLSFFSQFFTINFQAEFGWWFYNKGFWAAMWYIVLSSIVFSFIKIARERFGRGIFLKMLLGHYKNPQEEERIFMFLDLKDSTTIAEKLGYHKYSQFIQDCFLDLNEVVLNYNAEIYQYVGDEAVLSWPYKKGLTNNNCIGIFFAFEEKRQERKDYYLKKYGVFPEFKAGMHGGKLMAAEVGFVKKELAYHGDVINTSARIQAECNKYNATLLLSEKLLSDLNINSSSQFLGNILLKGKQEEVKIHSITAFSN